MAGVVAIGACFAAGSNSIKWLEKRPHLLKNIEGIFVSLKIGVTSTLIFHFFPQPPD